MKNMRQMMKQVQKAQAQLIKIQEELEQKTVEGTAGGGAVTAVVNGQQELISITIDEEVVDDLEMLQDLVLVAVNDGLTKAREMANKEMEKVTGSLNLPGAF
ncbi:MAG: YbaB/EbfC family nucleoid-associated protein [Firmicutes bacterium]|jgi:DNA-binding YbaB/EbfC family protein|nr:YbaB/EbfC family nucleoid-associated protein [Bacillota bacterium]